MAVNFSNFHSVWTAQCGKINSQFSGVSLKLLQCRITCPKGLLNVNASWYGNGIFLLLYWAQVSLIISWVAGIFQCLLTVVLNQSCWQDGITVVSKQAARSGAILIDSEHESKNWKLPTIYHHLDHGDWHCVLLNYWYSYCMDSQNYYLSILQLTP